MNFTISLKNLGIYIEKIKIWLSPLPHVDGPLKIFLTHQTDVDNNPCWLVQISFLYDNCFVLMKFPSMKVIGIKNGISFLNIGHKISSLKCFKWILTFFPLVLYIQDNPATVINILLKFSLQCQNQVSIFFLSFFITNIFSILLQSFW